METPRVDAYMGREFHGTYNEFIELADFARTLERDHRELLAAVREIERIGLDPTTKNPTFLAYLAGEAIAKGIGK